MDELASDSTHVSLLSRLRRNPDDQSAWEQFVDCYGPKISAWCKNWKLQRDDEAEVTQMVLVRLAAKMRTFRYDAEAAQSLCIGTSTSEQGRLGGS